MSIFKSNYDMQQGNVCPSIIIQNAANLSIYFTLPSGGPAVTDEQCPPLTHLSLHPTQN